ncbi:unnamed protein product [Boreogadus saida]
MNEDRAKAEIQAQRDDIERDRQFVKTEEMDEVKKMKENIQRQQLELLPWKRQIREREVLNTEIDTKKSNLEKSMRRTMMKQQDADKRRETVPQVKEDMEEKERSKKDDASQFATDTENEGAGADDGSDERDEGVQDDRSTGQIKQTEQYRKETDAFEKETLKGERWNRGLR